MGTFTTGIPLITRNIQPPLSPTVRIIINKIVANDPVLTFDSEEITFDDMVISFDSMSGDTKTFHVTIGSDNGYYASQIPITQTHPLTFSGLQYGTYTITESSVTGYTLVSITPSVFTISADNTQQIVEIINSKDP